MRSLYKYMFVLLVTVSIASPLLSHAYPIGGKVTAVAACPNTPGYLIKVVGFGVGTGLFWYLPGFTVPYAYTPPFVGQWVLGLSVPAFGPCGALPALMTGTSLTI